MAKVTKLHMTDAGKKPCVAAEGNCKMMYTGEDGELVPSEHFDNTPEGNAAADKKFEEMNEKKFGTFNVAKKSSKKISTKKFETELPGRRVVNGVDVTERGCHPGCVDVGHHGAEVNFSDATNSIIVECSNCAKVLTTQPIDGGSDYPISYAINHDKMVHSNEKEIPDELTADVRKDIMGTSIKTYKNRSDIIGIGDDGKTTVAIDEEKNELLVEWFNEKNGGYESRTFKEIGGLDYAISFAAHKEREQQVVREEDEKRREEEERLNPAPKSWVKVLEEDLNEDLSKKDWEIDFDKLFGNNE